MVRKKESYLGNLIDQERTAFSGGIFFALITLIVSLISKYTQSLGEITNLLLDLFGSIGYDLTLFGILLGIIYSFILGFILFYSYSVLYNKLPLKK